MSNATPLLVGLAGGLALWHFAPSAQPALRNATVKGTRDAAKGGRYLLDGGRVIVRDGQPLVCMERVDLGDARYALSPHETDELGARIVRLLNRRGAR